MPDYEESVRRAGGEPWVLDYAADPGGRGRVVLRRPAAARRRRRGPGALRRGGATRRVTDVDAARDEYEIALVARRARRRPAGAGHLPRPAGAERGGRRHRSCRTSRRRSHRRAAAHGARIRRTPSPTRCGSTPGSRLADVDAEPRWRTARPGGQQPPPPERRSASPTGSRSPPTPPTASIEALEQPDARFCVGVQWHPENFVDTGKFLPLFAGLVAAAR